VPAASSSILEITVVGL